MKRAWISGLILAAGAAGCYPTTWRRADAMSEASASEAGSDAGEASAPEAGVDASDVAVLDASDASDVAVLDASDGQSVDASDASDVAVLDASDVVVRDVPTIDAPVQDSATPDAEPVDALPTPLPPTRFTRTSALCIPNGGTQRVEFVIDRRGDARPFLLSFRSAEGVTIAPATAMIATSDTRVALELTDSMHRTSGSFTVEARLMGASPTSAPLAAASGGFDPGGAGAPDCTLGPAGITRMTSLGPVVPLQSEPASIDFMRNGPNAPIVLLGWGYDRMSGPGWLAGGNSYWTVHRFDTGGALDETFGEGAGMVKVEVGLDDNPELASAVRVDRVSGAIYAVGYGRQGAEIPHRGAAQGVLRLSASGVPDVRFAQPVPLQAPIRLLPHYMGLDSNDALHAVAIASDQTVYTAGFVETALSEPRPKAPTLLRFHPDGRQLMLPLASSATPSGAEPLMLTSSARAEIEGITFDGTRRLVVVGRHNWNNSLVRYQGTFVARYDLDAGALDMGFGVRGVTVLDPTTLGSPPGTSVNATAVAALGDGTIVVAGEYEAGTSASPALIRLSSSGAPQNWPGTPSAIRVVPCPGTGAGFFNAVDVHVESARIVAAGACGATDAHDTLLFVSNLSGTPTSSFGVGGVYVADLSERVSAPGGDDDARDVRFDFEGRIVAAISTVNTANRSVGLLMRFNRP